MPDELIPAILQHGGPVGLTLVLCYIYIRQLYRDLQESNKGRVEDQKAVVEKLLQLTDKQHEALDTLASQNEANQKAIESLKFVVLEHSTADLRRSRGDQ